MQFLFKLIWVVLKMLGVNAKPVDEVFEKLMGKPAEPPEEDWGVYWEGDSGDYSLVDKAGNKVTKETFANVSSFSEGLAGVERNGKEGNWGFVDPQGKYPFKAMYDMVQYFRVGLAPVQLKGNWGFVDKKGKEVIPFKYDKASPFNEFQKDLALVKSDGKWFYIDKENKFVKNSSAPKGWED